jgi:hypothetical protein
MFKIVWADNANSIQKWLRLKGSTVTIIDGSEDATVFSRSEANSVLLAIYNSGRWNLGGSIMWPRIVEVS